VVGSTLVAAALLTAFYRAERTAVVPILPLGLFRGRAVRSGTIAQLVSAAVMLPFFFLLPQYMQEVLGYSPLQTGLAYLPTSLAMVLVSSVVPMAVARFGTRAPYLFGVLFMVGASLLLTRTDVTAGYWSTLLPITAVMGVGLVICMMIAPIVGTSRATDDDAGAISAVLNSASEIGGAIGLAVAVTAVSSRLGDHPTGVASTQAALNDALHSGAWVMTAWAVLNLGVGAVAFGRQRAADPASPPL
jgi:Na+/melibiose symporter-like transporter